MLAAVGATVWLDFFCYDKRLVRMYNNFSFQNIDQLQQLHDCIKDANRNNILCRCCACGSE
jgi:hypothetical protein